MAIVQSVGQAIALHREAIRSTIEASVKGLLENKHLYQSIEVEIDKASQSFRKFVPQQFSAAVPYMEGAQEWPWLVADHDSLQELLAAIASKQTQNHVQWSIPDVKLYCKVCGRVEPFNGQSASNLINKQNPEVGGIRFRGKLTQVYCCTYLCQSCKLVPEVFLIRRHGARLTLCGRAPMEHVQTPRDIPKEVASYYSDAVVAFQSGQTLAALFLLRTTCEQWARRFALPTDPADVAIDKYMESLPDDFKGRFASIRAIYGELSAAIHSANGSSELYEKCSALIAEHFSARSIYKL